MMYRSLVSLCSNTLLCTLTSCFCTTAADIGALRKLIEALEDLDDTVSVTTNADLIDEP